MPIHKVPKPVLDALRDESKASLMYPRLARQLSHSKHLPEARILRRIARDERRHRKLLQKISYDLEKEHKH